MVTTLARGWVVPLLAAAFLVPLTGAALASAYWDGNDWLTPQGKELHWSDNPPGYPRGYV